MLIFTCHACTHMVAAGDTWVAMASGRHFVNHGVNTVEPFSANSHRPGPTPEEIRTWPDWAQWIANKVGIETVKYWHPTGWVNQNWLTHVIFYWLTTTLGSPEQPYFDALVLWKFAIYILAMFCIYFTCRLLGAHPLLSAAFTCFAMFTSRSFLDIRPQGFSNLLVAAFLLVLALTTYRNVLYVWLLVPLTVFWCNVHGGYIYVFIMLVPFVGLHLLASCSRKFAAILYNAAAWPLFLLVAWKNRSNSTVILFLVSLIVFDIVIIFFKDRLVSIGFRGVFHTIATGATAFVATVLFNPFHLTNLTHTFVISVSKHAERWRDVHEWHSAFAWDNPVGTGMLFLIILILSLGLLILLLLSASSTPRLPKMPKSELEARKKHFATLSEIFTYAATIFLFWVIFISFSFLALDAMSFIVCAVFAAILLLSVRTRIRFIYLVIPLTLVALWAAGTNTGYSGRYIYPFVVLPAYVIMHFVARSFSQDIRFRTKDIIHVAATAAVTLLLMMVVINPFRLKAAPWSVLAYLDELLQVRRVWQPEYEANLELNYDTLFPILYIVNIASVLAWFTPPFVKRFLKRVPQAVAERPAAQPYEPPRMDLPLMTIAALTIYMAVRSRRFIPIAAFAACPIVAMLIDRVIHIFSACRNFYKSNRFVVSAMPVWLHLFIAVIGTVLVLFIGVGWGLRFKSVYLDYWPSDTTFKSVFMRMTASDAKPFEACQFIRDNKLKGKMMNYWTEGGFIAWGQDPDPNTGKTPLQLFMDGRAQAAYDRKAFDVWTDIVAGGPTVMDAQIRGRDLTPDDYPEIGRWVSGELKKWDVWVALMPSNQFNKPFTAGLENNFNWRCVFLDNKQRLFVDITTPEGKRLFDGITTGETVYPDMFTRYLAVGHTLLLYGQDAATRKRGLDFTIQAFNLHPSPAPLLEILINAAGRHLELRPAVDEFCRSYAAAFAQNMESYLRQDGCNLRLESARIVLIHLERVALTQGDNRLAESYAKTRTQYAEERDRISTEKRW
jgi:hypothetical protein